MGDRVTKNHRRAYPTVSLLLVAVNIPLALLVGLLLVTDYRREMRRATDERRITLSDEAGVIGSALLRLSDPDDTAAITAFLESSCAETAGPDSPGHWIDVRWNGCKLHTHTGPIDSTVSVDAPNFSLEVIAGRFSSGLLTVEVSELAADIRRSVRGEILMHVSWLLGIAALAAVIVDVVLVRLIARPTMQLAASVIRLGSQQFEVEPTSFLSLELNDLSESISAMADSLNAAQANRATAMKRAEQIQRNLLPNRIDVPGLRIATHYQPAEEVAGDIYDVMKLRDGSWLIYVADLVGHGIPAAMSASILKLVIDSAAVGCTDPGELMGRVNRALPRYLAEDGFATAIMLRWNAESKELKFASAGHEPMLLIHEGEMQSIEATGLPLGVDETLDWKTETIQLHHGDRFMLLTDGISEATNESGEMFGRTRIQQLAVDDGHACIAELARTFADRVNAHIGGQPSQDDITLLVAQCLEHDQQSQTNQLRLDGQGRRIQ
ncbi:Phosphoserine phosphatase RsbU [Stieleria magnilauensis]|uniref:Phosphoserine phosphatase RsbU n=1 Tax=Stieleria magnilauensis TaxID=2527963 RepID=A0ABX5XTH7_9BACT|nr:Phosphoserine phosphatase RsbU [Planctomycetes bacterium TBK1r]